MLFKPTHFSPFYVFPCYIVIYMPLYILSYVFIFQSLKINYFVYVHKIILFKNTVGILKIRPATSIILKHIWSIFSLKRILLHIRKLFFFSKCIKFGSLLVRGTFKIYFIHKRFFSLFSLRFPSNVVLFLYVIRKRTRLKIKISYFNVHAAL